MHRNVVLQFGGCFCALQAPSCRFRALVLLGHGEMPGKGAASSGQRLLMMLCAMSLFSKTGRCLYKKWMRIRGLKAKHSFLSQTMSLEELLFEGRHRICDVHQDGDAYVSGGTEYSGWDLALPSSSAPSQGPKAPGFPYVQSLQVGWKSHRSLGHLSGTQMRSRLFPLWRERGFLLL